MSAKKSTKKTVKAKVPLKEDKSTIDTLMQLKDLTKRTGILYEAQVANLKLWPYVLFDIVEHAILPDDHNRILTFNLTFDKKAKIPKDRKKRCEALEAWVWELLGKEWVTKIRLHDGTWWHQGERGAVWVPPPLEDGAVNRELTFEDVED
jgi:hypothetical protein